MRAQESDGNDRTRHLSVASNNNDRLSFGPYALQPARPEQARVPRLHWWYRNKFPRPAGQGASLIERLFTGISGSQTGGQSVADISLSELVGGSSFGTWPLNLPGGRVADRSSDQHPLQVPRHHRAALRGSLSSPDRATRTYRPRQPDHASGDLLSDRLRRRQQAGNKLRELLESPSHLARPQRGAKARA